NDIATFQVNGFKCGIEICYDIHYEELAKTYRRAGCDLIFFPANFPNVFGKQWWELLLRARAMDNQLFVAGISGARNEKDGLVAYGHSIIIGPTGNVLTIAGIDEEIVFYEIDKIDILKFRKEMPLYESRRPDT
ncbi:Omega-amidase NIT2, partial [Pseudolycoriella hygida]